MVYFTCNHCGDAVKKPSVAKHYQQKCRGAPVCVSCMDCNKDFHGEEYAAHTSCITEAQRYSGKDYVAKVSKKSGQKKQETWTDIVRSILTSKEYTVTLEVRGIFQKLQSYDNVPRKKAKFQNFITNCMQIRKDQAQAVWSVLENALEKFKASRPTLQKQVKDAVAPVESDELKQISESNATNNGLSENGTDDVANKLKKRKRERNDEMGADIIEKKAKKGIEAVVSSSKDTKMKKQVKSAKPQSHVMKAKRQIDVTGAVTEKKLSKITTTKIPDSTISRDLIFKSTKDKNLRNGRMKICKMKSHGPKPNPDGVTSTNLFDWTEQIFTILKKNHGEIELDRLKTKMLQRYKSVHQIEDIPWKLERTFYKKLMISGLVVQDNIVKNRVH